MNKSNFKQIFLTLALLITAATGAWADGEKYTVQFKANGNTKTVEDVTLPHTFSCSYNKANDELDMILKELYGWTGSSDDTFCSPDAPSSDDASKATVGKDGNNQYVTISNAFEGTVTVTGKYCIDYIKTPYSLEISISVVETPLMTLNSTNTVATLTMPESDVTVEYSLVRDMIDETNPVEFGGLPASGDIIVKKGDDGKYQPASELTITLIDPLAAADAQNIIDSEDINIQVIIQKENAQGAIDDDPDKEPITLEAFLADMQPGYYRLKAVASETGAYDGTVYSVPLTLIEKYDLAIQPADDFSKDKLSEVTVAGAAQTLDADGKATVTNVAPGAEVKLKAKRGYVIEKVEAKKPGPAEGHDLTASAVGEIVGSDGLAYAAADKDNLPKGVTVVAVVAYKNGTGGLAIALSDEGAMNWSTAKSTCESKTGVGTYSWCLPSQNLWKAMFKANGGSDSSYSGLNTAITTAGGTALQSGLYWSSSEDLPGMLAWALSFGGGSVAFFSDYETGVYRVRAGLAF